MMACKPEGRKKVTPNELKKLIAQLQASGDKAQLGLMLEIMRDESYSPKIRFEAAGMAQAGVRHYAAVPGSLVLSPTRLEGPAQAIGPNHQRCGGDRGRVSQLAAAALTF